MQFLIQKKNTAWFCWIFFPALDFQNNPATEFQLVQLGNTDQGSQFTSMDGKDRALDNIRIERLWRSLKYEDICLKRYETMKELKAGINAYFNFYNTARFHQSLDYNVPDEMYKCFQYNELERKRAA